MSSFINSTVKNFTNFRSNPSSLIKELDAKKKVLMKSNPKSPEIKEITKFSTVLKDLDNLPEMNKSNNLCEIAAKQLEKFLEDENYAKYRTGNTLKGIIQSNKLNDYCLIADEYDLSDKNIVVNLLVNSEDKKNIAQQFLLDEKTISYGIAQNSDEETNYVVTIFSKEEQNDKGKNQQKKTEIKTEIKTVTRTGNYELPKEDLTELKLAFDLFDPEHKGYVKLNELIHAMDSMKFNETNPVLYKIVCDLQNDGDNNVSWEQFASGIDNGVSDRETDEGLEKMYGLIIDDPKADTMDLNVFKKICQEIGDNLTDEEIEHILKNTTENGEEISTKDFARYMKKVQ